MLNSSRIKILVKTKWYSIKLLKSPQNFLALAFNEWSCTGLWKIYAMRINMLWNPEAQCRCPSKKGYKKYIVYERVGKEALFIQGHWIFSFRTFAERLFIGKSATEGSRKKCESTNWSDWNINILYYSVTWKGATEAAIENEKGLQHAVFSRHWGGEIPMMQPKALHFKHCCQRDQTKTKSSIWKTTWEWQLQQIL